MGKIAFGLILLAIAYWLLSSTISDKRVEAEKQESETEKRLQIEKSVADMVDKHNAITDWKQDFDKKGLGLFEPTYTVEVEDALIRTDDRPIIFFAAVSDVVRETNKYSIHFRNWYGALLSADIHFILDCAPNQIKEIMLHRTGLFEKYAVIARVSEVKKVKLKATTSTNSDEVILEPSNVFMAKGHCLDLIFVGNYELSDNFLETKPK